MSIAILAVLFIGVASGYFLPEHITEAAGGASSYLLLLLLFSVGIDLGVNRKVFSDLRRMGLSILLIPAGVILGSLFGGAVGAVLFNMPVKEGLAISSGLGWYSLSGIMITEAGNPSGGAISFLSNVFREAIAFVTIPLLARTLNGYCAIASAGATAMDTTLGIISKNTDGKTAVVSFVSGIICTLAVPVLIPMFL